MITLKNAYIKYLETQVNGSVLEKDLSTEQYLCWSIPHQQEYTVQNWLGVCMGTDVVHSRRYIWLGKQGAIYVTKTTKFEKKNAGDTSILLDMKKWVWDREGW